MCVCVSQREGKSQSVPLSSRRRGSGWVVEKEAANAVAGRQVEGERKGALATTTQAEAGLGGGRGEHTKRRGERVRGKKEERKEVRGDASEWCEACDGAEAKGERAPTQQHARWDGRRRSDTNGRNSDSQRITRHNMLITPRHNGKRVAL